MSEAARESAATNKELAAIAPEPPVRWSAWLGDVRLGLFSLMALFALAYEPHVWQFCSLFFVGAAGLIYELRGGSDY